MNEFQLLVGQSAGTNHFEAVLHEQVRGTRGSATTVSSGEDQSVFGNLLEARFELAKRDVDIALQGA